ncbi:flagellar hook-associated protein FlgK [Peribacillus sp. SCS-155]|uniref:flagellar hook-associated protein FlgK n=1 Tax=Peribacillus sedimenti TaxID=3115297 RepID=UPI00390578D7
MRSTFMGLETARRGMVTQQSALYTTGHNIANANTPGFSRQRVNFNQTSPYPSVGMNNPKIPGQIGTGVEAGSVQRVREAFLDAQYRVENNKVGYYGTLSESLTKMEEIMNEPTDSGLHATLEKFWNSLQTLASHTENAGARDVVVSSGQMVADTLNYYYNSLTRIKEDIGAQIDVKVNEINNLISNIHNINQQIAAVEPNGYIPNDLYDQRDLLVDNLSSIVNVKVTSVIPIEYGNPNAIAEGLYNIELVQNDARSYSPPINLVSVSKSSGIIGVNTVAVNSDNGFITEMKFTSGQSISDLRFSGQLEGLITSYGYKTADGDKGYFPEMIENLNKMATAFANEFNRIHSEGYSLGGSSPSNLDFFTFTEEDAAKTIAVSQTILDNPDLLAVGLGNGASGDNGNAHILADLKGKSFIKYESEIPEGLTGSVDTFYSGLIGSLGVNSQSAEKNSKNSKVLADSVEQNRQSVSAVSLDEEMTNMIKFQHAYNASARQITMIDEMLDKIINGMGVVGR